MKNLFIVVLMCTILAGINACTMESQDPYARKIEKSRMSKDSFFKGSNESPFDEKGKLELVALKYYAPDKSYDVKGFLDMFEVPKSTKMQISNSEPEEYYKLGNIVFRLKGHSCVLGVYQSAKYSKDPAAQNELFCPFTDETNGKDTYKGGRFLDLKRTIGSKDIEIDFNYAYNPYCAYNHQYSCPVPPAGNHLDFKVEAGEKIYNSGVRWFK